MVHFCLVYQSYSIKILNRRKKIAREHFQCYGWCRPGGAYSLPLLCTLSPEERQSLRCSTRFTIDRDNTSVSQLRASRQVCKNGRSCLCCDRSWPWIGDVLCEAVGQRGLQGVLNPILFHLFTDVSSIAGGLIVITV